MLARQGRRRPTTRVEAVKAFGIRIPDDCEQIAADAATRRLHQTEDRVRGDRGVYRRAALLQNVDGGLRGQWLAGAGHSMLRNHFRAGREAFPNRTVAGESNKWRGHKQEQADVLHRYAASKHNRMPHGKTDIRLVTCARSIKLFVST
jgi:hypothetical protein